MTDRQLARLDAARAQLDATRAILRDATHDHDTAVRELAVAASAIAERVRIADAEQHTTQLRLVGAAGPRGER